MDDHTAGTVIRLPDDVVVAMWRHVESERPREACGLLAGTGTDVRMVYCLANIAARKDRYIVDPAGHHGALRHAESNGMELVGVFHSHPDGPAVPSSTDVAGALEPQWWYVVLGGGPSRELRAFRIVGGEVSEDRVVVTPSKSEGVRCS